MKKSMSKSQPMKRSDKQEGEPRGNPKLHIFLNILMYLIAMALVYFSFTHYSTIKDELLFNDAKTKKVESQIKLIVEISFLFSIFLFVNWVIHFLLTTFGKATENDNIVNAIKRNINVSFEHFVIFIGIFSYCLISEKVGYKKKEFVLFSNWFIISRVLYGVFSLFDAKFHTYFRELGSGIGLLIIIVMLSAVAGHSILDYI